MNVLWLLCFFFFYFQMHFLFIEYPCYKASCTYFMDLINFPIFLRILTILICFYLVSLYCLFSLSSFLKFVGFGFSHSCKNLSSKLPEHSCPFIIKNEALKTAGILKVLLFSILSFCNGFCFQNEASVCWSESLLFYFFSHRINFLLTP